MKLALCNEVIRSLDWPAQCEFSAAVGYDGIELAPFTLGDEPHLIGERERAVIRRAASDAGIAIEGLHWLLVAPKGLSITSEDDAVRARTVEVMRRLIGLCADLGGELLVHGSPAQRRLPSGPGAEAARQRGRDCFAAIAADAERAGVVYCVEPLAPRTSDWLNTVAEVATLVADIGSPAVRTMIDTCAASNGEAEPIPDLIDRWLPNGMVRHIQVNDANERGPGQGAVAFAPILAALVRNRYDGWVAVEPFDYFPDGPGAAARAAGYLRGIMETLQWHTGRPG